MPHGRPLPAVSLTRAAAIFAVGVVSTRGGGGAERRGLSRFTQAELQGLGTSTRARLRQTLRSEGAVLLTEIPGYHGTTAEALDAIGDCFRRLEAAGAGGGIPEAAIERPVTSPALLRGGVERWTLATGAKGGVPDRLPDWVATACPDLVAPTERLRGLIGLLLVHFAHVVDIAAGAGARTPEAPAAEGTTKQHWSLRHQSATVPAPVAPAWPSPLGALEDLVRRGTHLEHFHRYKKRSSAQGREPAPAVGDHALGMHTDAGLLQALAVKWRVVDGAARVGAAVVRLEVELPGGAIVAAEEEAAGTSFQSEAKAEERGGLLLLLGQASQEWLPHLRLRAAPHALAAVSPAAAAAGSSAASAGIERLVYGVMVLPPEDWVTAASGGVAFGEWWRRAQEAVRGDPGGNSSAATSTEDAGQGCLSVGLLQRRLQDQARTCPAGSLYCWMQCQVVPASLACGAERAICLSDSTGEVCPESGSHSASCKPACPVAGDSAFDAIGAGDSVVNGGYRTTGFRGQKRQYSRPVSTEGVARVEIVWDDHWASPYYGQWIIFAPGYKNGSALYYTDDESETPPKSGWRASDGATQAPVLLYASPSHARSGEGFCNGVLTSMHMLGFVWNDAESPCVIFLFHGLHLTDAARFWLAVACAMAMGVFMEFLMALQRWEAKRPWPPATGSKDRCARRPLRNGLRLLLYALSRGFAYMVMLVAMTYQVELFVAVVAGLTLGHGLFNLSAPAGERMTPCCPDGGQAPKAKQPDARGAPAPTTSVADSEASLLYKVTGMTCNSCCCTVKHAVESLGLVSRVQEVSLSAGTLAVNLRRGPGSRDAASDARQIQHAIEGVGFGALLLSPAALGDELAGRWPAAVSAAGGGALAAGSGPQG